MNKQITIKTIALIIAISWLVKPNSVFAQKEKGDIVVTGGASFSLVGLLANLAKESVNTSGSSASISVTPGMNVMLDYGVAKVFSLGVAASYQSLTSKYSDYYDDNGYYFVGNFKTTISRTNIGVRPLFHFGGTSENLDMYAGGRISYTLWSVTGDNTGEFINQFNSRPTFQALVGMRYFFTQNIGFNLEGAIGSPYYAMMGLNLKF
ncbi:MAG: hypothetical protein J0M08_07625 [Bacteroidetes bacterium]|nr:hypothetical protein [Bacteroidota bacterium]